MSPELFRAGFDLTRRMDQRFGHQTRTMSIRDVIYVTRAVLPHLAEYNITGLTSEIYYPTNTWKWNMGIWK